MPTRRNRDTAPRPDSVEDRLARLLDTPSLARLVPHLAPETIHQLVRHRGLEACGELITAATAAQLTSLLDLDLWRPAQAGRDDRFDVDRFGEWLEVLVDTGETVAARTVAALDPHLVTVGLSRYVRVFDPGTFEPTAATDDEPSDRHAMMNSETSRNVVECEVGRYVVRARRADAWDAIVTLLTTLDAERPQFFHAVMRGCRGLSNSRPEIDGLDDLLTAAEQQLYDVATERERRRSRHGYATPADARAFLQLARRPRDARHVPGADDPIAAAYFRAAETGAESSADDPSSGRSESDEPSRSIEAVVELLVEAGALPEPPRALLAAAPGDPRAARLPLLRQQMEFLLHHDEGAYLARSRELGFLANTLLAGCSVQSRPFTPQEASDAAASVCNLGLECLLGAGSPGDGSAAFFVDHDLITAFKAGWSVLHHEVSLFVADRLVSTLRHLRDVDADTRRGLRLLERQLLKQRKAGTPWLAREAADVLATIDATAWTSVVGLLDECPIVPAAMTAILERRTTPVSPTAFEFIATRGQIGDIRVFMGALPAVLAR